MADAALLIAVRYFLTARPLAAARGKSALGQLVHPRTWVAVWDNRGKGLSPGLSASLPGHDRVLETVVAVPLVR